MKRTQSRNKTGSRVRQARRMALYRSRARRAGRQRFEVNLPMPDAELIRHAVDQIRAGGAEAERMRALLAPTANPHAKIAKSAEELYRLFRSAPVQGLNLVFERDKSLPRDVDLF